MFKIQNYPLFKKQASDESKAVKKQMVQKNNNINGTVQEEESMIKELVRKIIRQRSQSIKQQKSNLRGHHSKRQASKHKKSNSKNQNSILQKMDQINNEKEHLNQNKKQIQFQQKSHCKNCNQCNCRKHHCKISFSQKDPSSKFISVYKKNSQQVKNKFSQQKPEMIASYLSQRISKVPMYNPKFESLYLQSQYNKDYNHNQKKNIQNTPNFNHLKLSSIKFGHKDLKLPEHFESAYNLQYRQVSPKDKSSRPFVVNNPQNLNNFGLKYHSKLSNYTNAYKNQNFLGKRDSLKREDKFKQLDLYLIKQSSYQQKFSLKKGQKSQGLTKSGISSHNHHLSSSLSKLEQIGFSPYFESSYKKQFQQKSIKDFGCPCSTYH